MFFSCKFSCNLVTFSGVLIHFMYIKVFLNYIKNIFNI